MTLATTHNRKEYTGNGTTDTFAYDFLILDSTHMTVYVDGVLQTEGAGADYTVTGVDNPAGGNVVFNAGSIPAASTAVTLLRTVPYTQLVDYVPNDKFSAETHEEALDKLTMIVQQFNERLLRAALLMVESTYSGLTIPDPVAEKYLAWKADLSGLKNVSEVTPGALTVSAFVETLLDDADASAILTTLGIDTDLLTLALPADTTISAFAKTLLDDANIAAAQTTLEVAPIQDTIVGDGTAGRVMRKVRVTILDATTAGEIKCAAYTVWNGDNISEVDDIGKGETKGGFTLHADGDILTIEASGLSGNCVAVLSTEILTNASGTVQTVAGYQDTNDIVLQFRDASAGTDSDLTVLVDTGSIQLYVTYLTDA